MAIETSEPYYLLSIKAEFVKSINKDYIKMKNNKKTDILRDIYEKGQKSSGLSVYDPRVMLKR